MDWSFLKSVGKEYFKETPESWETPEVAKWKATAESFLTSIYINYGGGQWDEYGPDDDGLLKAKICFALYGEPTDENYTGNTLLHGYNTDQQAEAAKIASKLRKIRKDPKVLLMFVVFIFCKMDEHEFQLPLFRVAVDDSLLKCKYVDSNLRVYDDWDDWKKNNALPMMKYATPVNGYYTCEEGVYAFDFEKAPLIEFGLSPACKTRSKVGRTADTVAAVTALAAGVVAIGGMFTPLAPVILVGSSIAGTSSAAYGAGRSGYRLIDKGTHDESLTDRESLLAMASIAVTPLSFGQSAVNAYLANGARVSGRIFSSGVRTFATFLNLTTFGCQSGLLVAGLYNLVEKAKKDQVTALDVLQFSMSVFFFTNTLMQPKTATGIINEAQQAHFKEYQAQLTDADAQQAFQRFLNDNKNGKGIVEQSKIVRSINRIDDPNKVFKGLSKFDHVEIGGRKGKTLIVGKDNGLPATRINPNKINFAESGRPTTSLLRNSVISKNYADTTVGGKKVFKNLNNRQIAKINDALACGEGPVRNQKIFDASIDLANDLNCKSSNDVLALYEIISSKVKGVHTSDIDSKLSAIKTSNRNDFISDLHNDFNKVTKIAAKSNLTFTSPIKALAHYAKHVDEFGPVNPGNMDFYLSQLPKNLFRDANLVDVQYNNAQCVKTYLMPDNTYGILKTNVDGTSNIATMFKHEAYAQVYAERMLNTTSTTVNSTWNEAVLFAQQFGRECGFANWEVNVHNGSQLASIECCDEDIGNPDDVVQALQALKDVYDYFACKSGLLIVLKSLVS